MWADGTDANYNTMSGIENCKAECDAHPDCAGFVLDVSDGVCGHWKSGPLIPEDLPDYDCYAKSITEIYAFSGENFD